MPISGGNLPNPLQVNIGGNSNGNLANQNTQQNMPLPNLENIQPIRPIPPDVDNEMPVGIVHQLNLAHAPYRPNIVIDDQGRPPSSPRGQDGERPLAEAMVVFNLACVP